MKSEKHFPYVPWEESFPSQDASNLNWEGFEVGRDCIPAPQALWGIVDVTRGSEVAMMQ